MRQQIDRYRQILRSPQTRGFVMAWLLIFFASATALTQQNGGDASCTIKDGRMVIKIKKNIAKVKLDDFVQKYDLSDLDLPKLLSPNDIDLDHLKKMGWNMDFQSNGLIIVSKKIGGVDELGNPEKRMALTEGHPNSQDLFPSRNDDLVYGFNRFNGKFPFAAHDSLVTFFLKGHNRAGQALLAGSFTNWQNAALSMIPTDSGWISIVKLTPGKYWYKFIVDGRWMVDPDNELRETDPHGNTNSVYYKPNVVFSLAGHTDSRDAYLTGSFNHWNPGELPMQKGPFGWTIPLYLAEGTYAYKFILDGKWYEDVGAKKRLPDGHNGFNSVYQLGKPHLFFLRGYPTAKSVALAGSFNDWTTYDLLMHKTARGWELPYTLGPGNYQYRFLVDGKWIDDPDNPLFVYNTQHHVANAFLIIQPNYTFRLEGYPDAKEVFLAGDFNDWTPNSLKMKKDGDAWTFDLHLSVGKHLYKFIVDGRWIKDPNNPLWEDNHENSVLWTEEK